jgi:hypothetical protein
MTIWSIVGPLEFFYGHLVYFVVIGIFFPVLVFWTKKNLATLIEKRFVSLPAHQSKRVCRLLFMPPINKKIW